MIEGSTPTNGPDTAATETEDDIRAAEDPPSPAAAQPMPAAPLPPAWPETVPAEEPTRQDDAPTSMGADDEDENDEDENDEDDGYSDLATDQNDDDYDLTADDYGEQPSISQGRWLAGQDHWLTTGSHQVPRPLSLDLPRPKRFRGVPRWASPLILVAVVAIILLMGYVVGRETRLFPPPAAHPTAQPTHGHGTPTPTTH